MSTDKLKFYSFFSKKFRRDYSPDGCGILKTTGSPHGGLPYANISFVGAPYNSLGHFVVLPQSLCDSSLSHFVGLPQTASPPAPSAREPIAFLAEEGGRPQV